MRGAALHLLANAQPQQELTLRRETRGPQARGAARFGQRAEVDVCCQILLTGRSQRTFPQPMLRVDGKGATTTIARVQSPRGLPIIEDQHEAAREEGRERP